MKIKFRHPQATEYHLGFIPEFLNESDPRSAKEQLHTAYRHGGGWNKFSGFTLNADDSISYPGDPSQSPLAEIQLRDEKIVIYPHGWVAIIQPDRSYEIARMD